MLIRHPHLRRRARIAACAGAAFSVAMFTTTAWVGAESGTPAAAEPEGFEATVVSLTDGNPLFAGDQSTPWSLKLPADAACPGDSVAGWATYAYMVPVAVDPGTLTFNSEGPEDQHLGEPYEDFIAPLWDVDDLPYASVSTVVTSGLVKPLPEFDFEVLVLSELDGLLLPSGEYNVGIACKQGALPETPIERFWNATIIVESTPAAPAEPASATFIVPQATTTALATLPATQALEGDSVKLTATLTPAGATGTVTVQRDGADIGTAVTVAAGKAELTVPDFEPGAFALTAEFTPSGPEFEPSTSNTVNYTVVADEPTATTTEIEADPADEALLGDEVALTATVTPADAAGTVTFLDGADPIGDPVAVAAGEATTTVDDLVVGAHTLTAEFTPTDPEAFAASESDPLDYTITEEELPTLPPAVGDPARIVVPGTTTDLDSGDESTQWSLRLPAGAACPGDSVTQQYAVFSYMVPVDVDPAELTFLPEGPVGQHIGEPYADFRAPLWDADDKPYVSEFTVPAEGGGPGLIKSLPAFDFEVLVLDELSLPSGIYNLGIACWGPGGAGATPTVDQFWNVRISVTSEDGETPSATWTAIQPIETTTGLTAQPEATADEGDEVTFSVDVTPTDAAGTVTFFRDETAIGTPQTVTAGKAELETSDLEPGTFDVSARFTPTDANEYSPSESGVIAYEIVGADPVETTITMTVSPSGEADLGDDVTLTATVTPASAAGTVAFLDGSTELDGDVRAQVAALTVAVSNGTARLVVDDLAAGNHTLTARFTPTDADAFAASQTASGVTLSIRAQATTTTSTSTTSTSSTSTSTTLGGSTTSTTAGGSTTSTTAGSGTLPRTGTTPGTLVVWAFLAIVLGWFAMRLGQSPKIRTNDR